VGPDAWQSPAGEFCSEAGRARVGAAAGLEPGHLLLLLAEPEPLASTILSRIRLQLGERLGRLVKGEDRFLWIVDFPLLERDPEADRYVAVHHPFTAPLEEDLDRLESHPLEIRSHAYALVLNGPELARGSIRLH